MRIRRALYQDGHLTQAIDILHGSPVEDPLFLADLLCFAGQFQDVPPLLQGAADLPLFLNLLQAALWRRQVFEEGREPIGPCPLAALDALRQGSPVEAADLLAEAEARRLPLRCAYDGVPVEDFRDLDDRTAACLEVFTPDGQYHWLPIEHVVQVDFMAPRRPRDLLWRPAHLVAKEGPSGLVFLPCLYPGSDRAADDALRLGRATQWLEREDSPVIGLGQRTFLFGTQEVPMIEITSLLFDTLDPP